MQVPVKNIKERDDKIYVTVWPRANYSSISAKLVYICKEKKNLNLNTLYGIQKTRTQQKYHEALQSFLFSSCKENDNQ